MYTKESGMDHSDPSPDPLPLRGMVVFHFLVYTGTQTRSSRKMISHNQKRFNFILSLYRGVGISLRRCKGR